MLNSHKKRGKGSCLRERQTIQEEKQTVQECSSLWTQDSRVERESREAQRGRRQGLSEEFYRDD